MKWVVGKEKTTCSPSSVGGHGAMAEGRAGEAEKQVKNGLYAAGRRAQDNGMGVTDPSRRPAFRQPEGLAWQPEFRETKGAGETSGGCCQCPESRS